MSKGLTRRCLQDPSHAGPIFLLRAVAIETGRGKDKRKTLSLNVGHFCGACLLRREYTFEGGQMVPGRGRVAQKREPR